MDNFLCPICQKSHSTLARYPKSVCKTCLCTYKTKDEQGNIKNFYNIDMFGGIRAVVNGVDTTDYSCYVNNIECYGQVARFGGIVINKLGD